MKERHATLDRRETAEHITTFLEPESILRALLTTKLMDIMAEILSLFLTGIALLLSWNLFRDWLNPGVLYALAWFGGAAGAFLVGELTFGVSAQAAALFVIVTACFNVGVYFSISGPLGKGSSLQAAWLQDASLQNLLTFMCVVVVGLVPLFIDQKLGVTGSDEVMKRLYQLRAEQVQISGETGTFSLLNNLPALAQFLTILTAATSNESFGKFLKLFLFATSWMILGLATGSKLVALQVPIMVFFTLSLRRGKINAGLLILTVLAALLVFALGVISINFGYSGGQVSDLSLSVIGNLIVSYFLGGVIGLSEMLKGEMISHWGQNTMVSVMYTINAVLKGIGFKDLFEIGYQHAPFIRLGPDLEGNVYTAIFSYFSTGGWIGIFVWPLMAGLLCGYVYRAYQKRKSWAIISLPVLLYGVVASAYSEQIFSSFLINMKLQILLLVSFAIVSLMRSLKLAKRHLEEKK